jgi:hypothetical protein
VEGGIHIIPLWNLAHIPCKEQRDENAIFKLIQKIIHKATGLEAFDVGCK